jgi:uncharacterized membrane protein YphA (DoxX/SURF4 family)
VAIILAVLRLFVGLAFVTYGLVKLLGGQFVTGDFVLDSRTTDPTTLVWCFYGYSPVYARFIGLCEFIPGLLLLIPRTRTLGAACLLPISLNITVMDFCFGFPAVKYFSLLLTLLTAVLVAADARKLKRAFWDAAEAGPPGGEAVAGKEGPRRRRLGAVLLIVVGLIVVAAGANLVCVAVLPGPEEPARERCAREGWDPAALRLKRWWRTRGDFGIGMEAVVEFEAHPDETVRVRLERPVGFVPWHAVAVEQAP